MRFGDTVANWYRHGGAVDHSHLEPKLRGGGFRRPFRNGKSSPDRGRRVDERR
jgi:hypothetical protein